MTLTDDVCEQCNSVTFAPLDEELIRFVRPFLKRTMKVKRSLLRESLSLTYDGEKEVWSAIRIGDDWKPIVCPQVAFTSPTNVQVAFDGVSEPDCRAMFSTMVEELREPTTLAIDEKILPHDSNSPPIHPILVRTAKKSYLIIAECSDEVSSLRERIASGKIAVGLSVLLWAPAEARKIEQPLVSSIIQRDFSEITRAVVKTAINYVCKVLGPDVARCAELEALRTYACFGGESREAVHLVRDKAEWRWIAEAFGSVCTPNQHALVLLSSSGRAAVLQLLEGQIFHVVDLGAIPSIPNGTIIVTIFDPQTRTHTTNDFEPPEHIMNALRRAG